MVTGSTQGLGLAVARRLGSAGCDIVLHGLGDAPVVAALPQALAQVSAARVRYLANLRSNGDQRMLSVLRWHIYNREAADQIRAGTMAPIRGGVPVRPVPADGRVAQW